MHLEPGPQITQLLVEPAAVLQEVEKDEPLEQQLRLAIGLRRVEFLIVLKVVLDPVQTVVEASEEVFGESFLVESRGPGADPDLCLGGVLRPPERRKVEFADGAI